MTGFAPHTLCNSSTMLTKLFLLFSLSLEKYFYEKDYTTRAFCFIICFLTSFSFRYFAYLHIEPPSCSQRDRLKTRKKIRSVHILFFSHIQVYKNFKQIRTSNKKFQDFPCSIDLFLDLVFYWLVLSLWKY